MVVRPRIRLLGYRRGRKSLDNGRPVNSRVGHMAKIGRLDYEMKVGMVEMVQPRHWRVHLALRLGP